MNFSSFVETTGDFFEGWFRSIAFELARGTLRALGPYSYPTNFRIGESAHHFVGELCGSTEIPEPELYRLNKPKRPERVEEISSFFNPGFSVPRAKAGIVNISATDSTITGMALCTPFDQEVFQKKISFPLASTQIRGPNATVPLVFAPMADRICFQSVDLVRADSFRIFFRTISTAIVVRKDLSKDGLLDWLSAKRGESLRNKMPLGINGYDSSSESFSRELASLADQDIDEPVIDAFIQSHAGYFARALGYKRALNQIRLLWADRCADDPKESVPDYLMQRADGYYDILDLKRALLPGRAVTRGEKPRIRFNAYVGELIGQLAGYQRYFTRQKNSNWAFTKHGVKLKDARLIGVVGNYDTFQREAVDVALEQYRDNIALLSYADVVALSRRRVDSVNAGKIVS